MLRDALRWVPVVAGSAAVAWLCALGPGGHRVETATDLDDRDARSAANATLIVDFRDDVGDAALAANRWAEEAVSRYSAVDRLYRLRFADDRAASAAFEELLRDPTVESVDWDVAAALFEPGDFASAASPAQPGCTPAKAALASAGFPDDPCWQYQWHLRQIGLPAAWKLGQGKKAVVAVIDTGVTDVPDMAGVEIVEGYDFVHDRADASDDHGHGTHVAGTIAQATHNGLGVAGVAFGARIMPIKVLSAQGSGSMASIAQGIRWAADHGANVINMSLGGAFPVGSIRNAVKYARERGVVVVAAAGNDGRGRVSYPARYPGVIAVAATQFDETTTFYSNWGREIDVAAPGGNVRVDQNGDGFPDGVLQNTVVPGGGGRTDYLWFMGTSMATPHVAGAAALLVGAGVTRPEAVEALLIDTARKPKARVGHAAGARIDDHLGAGIIDAQAALKAARAREVGGPAALALAWGTALVASRRRRRGGFSPRGKGVSLGLGALGGLAAPFIPVVGDTPVVLSAALPVAVFALLWSVGRLRGLLAGLAIGFTGVLTFAALIPMVDIQFLPQAIERPFVACNALLAAALAGLALRD